MNLILLLVLMALPDFRACIPPTDNADINKVTSSPDLYIYTEETMPSAYQLDGNLKGRTEFHWAGHNISGDAEERLKPHGQGGNGNIEFPWREPGGTDVSTGKLSFKFMYLPPGKPIVYLNRRLPVPHSVDRHPIGVVWIFPKGTVFGEVLVMKGPDGFQYTYEMRVREKMDKHWEVDIFRPYPTAKSLLAVIPADDPVAIHLKSSTIRTRRLADDFHTTKRAFVSLAGIDELPAFGDPGLATKLLKGVTFKTATGESWRQNCFAPTTKADWHIVPKGYMATFLGSDSLSCAKCHESSLQHVNTFQAGRGWYGYVRGSDDILSFHPVEPNSLVNDGGAGPIVLRKEFLEKGWLEKYDPAKHSDYHEVQ